MKIAFDSLRSSSIPPKDRNPLGRSANLRFDESGEPRLSAHKTFDLQKLKDQHREIARLIITGHTNIQISRLLDLTPVAIRLIKSSSLFQDLISELTKEADCSAIEFSKHIQSLRETSLDIIEETLDSDTIDKALQVKTAFGILDRKSDGHVKEAKGPSVSVNLSKSFVSYDLSSLRSENPPDFDKSILSEAKKEVKE